MTKGFKVLIYVFVFAIFPCTATNRQAPKPPVDLHWFFEISIRTEKKIQLELKKKSVSLY